MKQNEAFPSNFLKAADLNEEEMVLTIARVEQEKIGDDDKLVAYFKGTDKRLVINKTNFNAIVKATGEDDTDDWNGKRITLYPTETNFKGDTVDCIRVKTKPPKAEAVKPKKATEAAAAEEELEDAPF
jgi:hypothetical protein